MSERSETIIIRQLMKYLEELVVIQKLGTAKEAKSKKIRLLNQLDQKNIPYYDVISKEAVEQLIFLKSDGDAISHPEVPSMSREEVLFLLEDEDDDESTTSAKQELVDTMFRLQDAHKTTFGVLPLYRRKK